MNTFLLMAGFLSGAGLLTWLYLIAFRGGFWKTDQRLDIFSDNNTSTEPLPSVSVLVPARNESKVIAKTLPALLKQHYAGEYHIYLIDDCRSNLGFGLRRITDSSNQSYKIFQIVWNCNTCISPRFITFIKKFCVRI